MNVASYYWNHVIPTGFQTFLSAFKVWCDLIKGNYDKYSFLLHDEDPYTECREWFWFYLNNDQILPREFLEKLQDLINGIDTGKVNLSSFSTINDFLKESDGDV